MINQATVFELCASAEQSLTLTQGAASRGAAIPPAEETARAECRVAMYINIVETLHCSCSARRMDSALSEELGLDMLEVTHAVSAFQVATDHLEANTSPKARLEEGFGTAGLGRPAGTLRRNTYNFCNAPHVNATHYELPPNITATRGQLVHVSVVMCHRKRTLNNLAPSERTLNPPMGRTHIDVVQHVRSRRRSDCARRHDATMPSNHPFACTIWSGSCDARQLCSSGLSSSQHGLPLARSRSSALWEPSPSAFAILLKPGVWGGCKRGGAALSPPTHGQSVRQHAFLPSWPAPKTERALGFLDSSCQRESMPLRPAFPPYHHDIPSDCYVVAGQAVPALTGHLKANASLNAWRHLATLNVRTQPTNVAFENGFVLEPLGAYAALGTATRQTVTHKEKVKPTQMFLF
ncbi:hypothetical protein BC826DRAFT_1109478 [Russula brevipes]|nr:hypothetical protein BC826DRAFT_1110425 [Russula brevipes]KAI0284860.1 hypothetical protein BC826DRAFT_1109478 [Russula brevipes]